MTLYPWVVLVHVVLAPLAANPMSEVRKALGMTVRGDKKSDPPRAPSSDADLAAARARLQPELVGALGIAAIVMLVWLMQMKPF